MPSTIFKKSLLIAFGVLLAVITTSFIIDKSFLDKQKSNTRVKSAYTDKQVLLTQKLKPFSTTLNNINILITAFKTEQQLVIYIKKPSETAYRKFASYDICSASGTLGPKRQRGDGQVPEGFYYIDRFNPVSNFFLSLGLNYPNQADRVRAGKNDPGADIFIHGNCVTIGCMPMTDDFMKEIYILALQARHSGQAKIPVYVYPFKFNSVSASQFAQPYQSDKLITAFWNNLKKGYDKFNANGLELKVGVSARGEYTFN